MTNLLGSMQNLLLRGTEAIGKALEQQAGGQSGLTASLNNLSSEWQAFEEQQAYQGQPDYGAAYNWQQPIPEYNYAPPGQITPPSLPGAGMPVVNPYAEIVAPAFTRTYDVSAPVSQAAPLTIDPAWFSHEEEQWAQGQPDMGAGVDWLQLDPNYQPQINSAGQAILNMDTPADLIGTGTPWERSPDLDPVGRGLGFLAEKYDAAQQWAGGGSILPSWLGGLSWNDVIDASTDLVAEGIRPPEYIRDIPVLGTALDAPATVLDFVRPRGLLDLGIEATPLGFLGDVSRAFPESAVAREALGALPEGARLLRNPLLEVPQYSDEALSLAQRHPGLAGVTTVNPRMPTQQVAQLPFGQRVAGAADETIPPSLPGPETVPSSPSAAPGPGARYYHETTANDALYMLESGTIPDKGLVGKSGVYLADTPELALGQGGKGGLVEFDASLVDARPAPKPGQSPEMAALGQEYVTTGAKPLAVTQVTLQQPLDNVTAARLRIGVKDGDLLVRENADGSLTVTRGPNSMVEASVRRAATPQAPTGAVASPAAPPAQPPTPRAGAATAVAEPPGSPEFAGNIRLSKYPEDLRGTVKSWADANPEAVQQARRGIQSDADVRAAAEQLVNDVGGDFDKLQKGWKPGEAWNAEEVTAIRGALNDATRNVLDAASAARLSDSTANQLRLAEAILEQQRIQQIVHGVTAEAGRALRAFRQQTAAALADNDVAKMNELLSRAMKGGTQKDVAELTELIKALDVNSPAAVNNFLRQVNKPGFWDYMYELWINSVLSGPVTHLRNIFGNTVATLYAPVERVGAAGVEGVVSRVQGRASERFWQEAPAAVHGALRGVPEGVRSALEVLRYGTNPLEASRLEMRRTAFSGGVGRVVRFPSTALEAMDSFFFNINYRSSLHADAVRQARTEGLKGPALQNRIAELVQNPTARMVKHSSDEAERLLFRNDPGKAVNTLMSLRGQVPGLKYVIPFIKTPANLFSYGVKHSPLGLLDVPMWKRLAAGSPEASDEVARTLMGSAIGTSFGALLATGAIDITAGVPANSAERDRFYREGKLPFSIKIPGVGWVQYNQIPVLDTTLTSVGSVMQGVREGNDVSGIVSTAIGNIAQNMMDKSYLNGLSDLFDAIADPERYAERFMTRQVTGFIPYSAAMRQTAQTMDRTIRQPDGLWENVQAGIPGLTGNVPARLDAFGEESQRPVPSPLQANPDRQTAVDAELERLEFDVGFVGKSIGGYSLNREQQALYQAEAGQRTYALLDAFVRSSTWATLSDGDRTKLVEKVVTRARDEVRDPVNALLKSEGWALLGEDEQNALVTGVLSDPKINAVLKTDQFKTLSAEQQRVVLSKLAGGISR